MKRFLFSLIVLLPFAGFSQSNFKKGYLITSSNDSISGYINYKERGRNPTSVTFKTDLQSESRNYDVQNCKSYSIEGIEHYKRFAINVSLNSDEITRLSYGLDTTVKRDTVFLQVLQEGKNVTLYSYTDQIKTRFYLLDHQDTEPVELLFVQYLNEEGGRIQQYKKYVRQLHAAMSKYNGNTENYDKQLRFLKYSKTDLIHAVSDINNQEVERQAGNGRIFVGAGLSSSKMGYSGNSVFNGKGVTAKNAYTPMLTVGIDLFSNPNIGRLIYRAELSFFSGKNEITSTNVNKIYAYKTHSFDAYTFAFTPQVIYNFYNTNPLKVFLGAGANLNLSSNRNNVMYTKVIATDNIREEKDKVDLNNFYFTPQVNGGIVIQKRIEIFAVYCINTAVSNYVNYNVTVQRSSIGLKYLFAKK